LRHTQQFLGQEEEEDEDMDHLVDRVQELIHVTHSTGKTSIKAGI
jgi:hypothetical protein